MGTGDRIAPFTVARRLERDGLVIRCYERDDAREMMEAITASVEHLRPWMPWIQFEPQDVHDKRKLIREFEEEWESRSGFPMGIYEGAHQVGATGFHVRGPEDSLEIGYWVHVNHQHRGIVTRSVEALIDEAFSHKEVQRVFINHDEANIASGKVPERLGFSIAGRVEREPIAPGECGILVQWQLTRNAWSGQVN